MNTLCMKMTAKNRTKDGNKHRKVVLREMKTLSKRTAKHARKHLDLLTSRGHETDLTPGQIEQITQRIQGVLDQLPAAIKQAHEHIIGGRKLLNKDKILSLYDPDVQVIVRGKSNAEIEFGNNLWLGETRQGFIADYRLEKEKTSDAKQIQPAISRHSGGTVSLSGPKSQPTNKMPKLKTNPTAIDGSSSHDLLAFVKTSARAVRRDLADSIEEIGQALGLLRECIGDADNDNLGGAQMCADDALEILVGLEARFSGMAAKVASFSEANDLLVSDTFLWAMSGATAQCTAQPTKNF